LIKINKSTRIPPVQLVIEPSRGLLNLKLHAVWRYRELLYFLVWRDIKVRYKQTILGVTWVVIQPVVSMLVFSGLFGVLSAGTDRRTALPTVCPDRIAALAVFHQRPYQVHQ
jgi:hypothetical protein